VAVCTAAFYRLVERPSHTAARQAGRAGTSVAAALARREAPATPR
jgi:hypothetical protein